MDRTIQRICNLLQSPDGMRRCAAAMVLAELAPRDGRVVKALGDSLKDANQLLTRYVLEALDAIGTRAVVPYVLPMLDAEDLETKLRAAGIVARAGATFCPSSSGNLKNRARSKGASWWTSSPASTVGKPCN